MHDFDPRAVAVQSGCFVDGRIQEGSDAEFAVARPSDGCVYGAIRGCSDDEVDGAVESSWRAFRQSDWARCSPRKRAQVLRKWADLIDADYEVLAPLEAVGSTRPIAEVLNFDIPFTADGIRFFAELADKIGGDAVPTQATSLGLIVPEPYGVVAAIAPWNFPMIMASWKFAPALAAGNTVVLKPSELTPFTAVRLAELAIAAGMPPGVFNVVQGQGASTGQALCRHPRVSKITFTGSGVTGKAIMRAAADAGAKPVTLELGGKSPQIVFDDPPDLDKAAEAIARSITGNAGQVCVAGSRLIAHEAIAEALIERIVHAFHALIPGPTWHSNTTLSPLISDVHAYRVHDIVRRSVDAGAEVLSGGKAAYDSPSGAYYLPTILSQVTSDTPAVTDEVFGPVLTLQTFHDDDEALTLAQHPKYGLAAGVHTKDVRRAMRAVRHLACGTVWINRYGRSWDFILPTGGYGQSGVGKDLGLAAFEANLRFKSVLLDFDDASSQ